MEKSTIDPKEISVVVRGLIVGNDQADEKKKFTKRSLASVRKYLPGAQIILSSWEGSDVSGLDYDDLVLTKPLDGLYTMSPNGKPKLMAVNNQITTSQNGLKKVRGEYTLNMRSDMILAGAGFIDYFIKYNEGGDGELFKKKVVVLPTYNPRRPTKYLFNICDWFFFGLTEDIKNLFDIPLMNEDAMRGEKINGYYPWDKNFESEQYIWTTFLKKYKDINFPYNYYFTEEALKSSEESYARNTIMVPAHKAKIMCLRMPHAGYGAYPILSHGLYTFNEYKKMYNRYNTPRIFYVPNPVEDLLYFIFLDLRLFIKKASPNLYKKIINLIRESNGSSDLLK